MELVYATQNGKKGLEARLADLISKRAEIANQIKIAREFGDLKENAEYAAAREAQNNLEMEITEIEETLPNIKLFSYAKAETNVVNLGTRVSVEVVSTKAKVDFVITGVLESCIEKGYVSNASPIGSALLGQKVGDTVEVKVPAGRMKYKITKISKVEE
ncbi:MAG: transcription elongation factor GreA [Firmicutes bacterium]|nr:transcription elongation factor GreA [Bacillota bacterium]